jgi:ankyrin repeat protein
MKIFNFISTSLFVCLIFLSAFLNSGCITKNAEEETEIREIVEMFKNNAHEQLENGMTILMWAAAENTNPNVIHALIKAGAKIDEKDHDGCTALMFAAMKNSNPKIIKALIKAGADINEKENEKGTDSLMLAALINPEPEITKALINAGADINAKDNKGGNALVLAAMSNPNPAVIQALIDGGADINVKMDEASILDFAEFNDNPEVKKLIENLMKK